MSVGNEPAWHPRLDELADAKSPADARELAPRPSPVMVWRPEHLGAFLDTAHGDGLYALFHLIAYRGLRRGEAAGVEWEDVGLDAAVLTVRRQRVQLGWEVIKHDQSLRPGGAPWHWMSAPWLRCVRTDAPSWPIDWLGFGVGGLRQGVHSGKRGAVAPSQHHGPVPRARGGGRPTTGPAAQSATRRRLAHARGRG